MRHALVAALLVGVALPVAGRAPEMIEDDYPRARDLARERGQLLFVDAWAPW